MLSRFRLPWPRYREIPIGSRRLTLDMRSSHERRYYDLARRGASDLDMKIWERFGAGRGWRRSRPIRSRRPS